MLYYLPFFVFMIDPRFSRMVGLTGFEPVPPISEMGALTTKLKARINAGLFPAVIVGSSSFSALRTNDNKGRIPPGVG